MPFRVGIRGSFSSSPDTSGRLTPLINSVYTNKRHRNLSSYLFTSLPRLLRKYTIRYYGNNHYEKKNAGSGCRKQPDTMNHESISVLNTDLRIGELGNSSAELGDQTKSRPYKTSLTKH